MKKQSKMKRLEKKRDKIKMEDMGDKKSTKIMMMNPEDEHYSEYSKLMKNDEENPCPFNLPN